jgi:hypothetical protein
MSKRLLVLVPLGLLASSAASAQAPWGAPPISYGAPPAAAAPRPGGLFAVPRAPHAIYLSATSLLITNGGSVNYAYRPLRMLAISAGVGVSGVVGIAGGGGTSAYGGQAMAHLLFGGDSAHSFELALGGGLVFSNDGFLCVSECGGPTRGLAVAPATQVGYRFHPLDGGFLFRTGVAWELGLGVGVNLSFGGAF